MFLIPIYAHHLFYDSGSWLPAGWMLCFTTNCHTAPNSEAVPSSIQFLHCSSICLLFEYFKKIVAPAVTPFFPYRSLLRYNQWISIGYSSLTTQPIQENMKLFGCVSDRSPSDAQSKKIEKQLKEDKQRYKSTHRLLLLGMLSNWSFLEKWVFTFVYFRCWRVWEVHYCETDENSSH